MAEFGYHTIGASNDNPSNACCCFKATSLPASSGTLTTISLYCVKTVGAPVMNLALYADNAGVPGALIAQGVDTLVPASFSWLDIAVAAAIVAGTQYWLAAIQTGGGGTLDSNVKFDTAGGATEFYYKLSGPPGTGVFPASFASPDGNVPDSRWSIYATYTPTVVASKSFDGKNAHRAAPFKPQGDAFRTGKFRSFR